jgi:hypothetical protein
MSNPYTLIEESEFKRHDDKRPNRLTQITQALNDASGRWEEYLFNRVSRLQRKTAAEWAALNGLRWSPNGFSLSAVQPGKKARWDEYLPVDVVHLDHAEFFHAPKGRWRAIVAHLYGPDAAARAGKYAWQHGFLSHIPPIPTTSWYSPGRCTIFAYTSPGVCVAWLPEQAHGD